MCYDETPRDEKKKHLSADKFPSFGKYSTQPLSLTSYL